jgi:ribosome-associated protein
MSDIEFLLNAEYIALCDLLKLAGLADSGGMGKQRVAGGEVRVDGQVETRKKAKIRAGQCVECDGVRVQVLAGVAGVGGVSGSGA